MESTALPTLTVLHVQVAESLPTKLEVSWAADDIVPSVHLGAELPDLVISTKDESGKVRLCEKSGSPGGPAEHLYSQ